MVLNSFDKTFTCINNDGKLISVKGIPRKTALRQISALQLKRVVRKGCKVYGVIVIDEANMKIDKVKSEDIPILKEYSDVFPKEIMGMPPKRELDITIELVPGAVPSSKSPYQMNILELNELNSNLNNLLIRIILDPVCLQGEHMLFLLRRRIELYDYV